MLYTSGGLVGTRFCSIATLLPRVVQWQSALLPGGIGFLAFLLLQQGFPGLINIPGAYGENYVIGLGDPPEIGGHLR